MSQTWKFWWHRGPYDGTPRRTHVETGIYLSHTGSYEIYWHDEAGDPRWKAVGTDLTEARRARVKARAASGVRKKTLAWVAENWLADFAAKVEGGHRSRATLQRYQEIYYTHIEPRFGHRSISKIAPSAYEKFLFTLTAEGQAESTVELTRTVVRQILKYAETEELLARGTAKRIRRTDSPQR